MLGHESRQIGSGQTGDGESERRILGISELKWIGMGKFIISTTVGKNP